LPAAGAKGYGLALVVDVLTAALAGTPIGREIQGWDDEQAGLAAFFLALDPGAFGPLERFASAVGRLAEQVRATAPLEDGVPVRLPGERASGERRLRSAGGVPFEAGAWERMESELRALGLELPAPPAPSAS
jgi:LDH2 family malate/lactate/ureidoglycolate dehydrogenase